MHNNKRTKDTVFDFEPVSAPIGAEIKLQKADRSWWENNTVLVSVAIAMALMDAMFLWDMLDYVMMQNATLGIIGSIGIALILNLIPLTLAKQINNARYNLDKRAGTFAVVAGAIFTLLYAAVVILRFHCLELYTNSTTDTLLNTVSVDAETETISEETKLRAIMTALLLSIEPLATSGFSFVLAILTDNPLRNKINELEKRLIEIRIAKNRVATALASMWEDKEFLMNNDEAQFATMKEIILDDVNRLKAEGRMMLAEKIGDPSAISHLSLSLNEEKNHEKSGDKKLKDHQ